MKFLLLFLSFTLFDSFSNCFCQKTEEEFASLMYVDVPPKFGQGDLNDFIIWVYSNLKYPEQELKDSVSGRVILRFWIDSTGLVKNDTILRSGTKNFDAEAKRVVELSPKWIPATQGNNHHIAVPETMPIDFDIKDVKFINKINSLKSSKTRNKHDR
jgi:TonB family protein